MGAVGGETAETIGSSRQGAVDVSSALARRTESDPGAASASDADEGDGEDPPAVLLGKEAHELSNWGRLPATVRGRTRDERQCLEGEPAEYHVQIDPEVEDPEVEDAVLVT